MAEIRKITCDMCGCDIQNGYVFRPSSRRRITHGTTTNGAYRFDLCDKCFERLQEACTNDRKAEASDGRENTQQTRDKGGQL